MAVTTLLSAGEVAAWPCMTPEEYELWRLETYGGAKVPCVDCPRWFADQARAAGRCKQQPRRGLRPRGRRGPPPVYATVQEQLEARRRSCRESKRRARARCIASQGGAQ